MFLTPRTVLPAGFLVLVAIGASATGLVPQALADQPDQSAKRDTNTLSDAEKAAGWKLLFDGKTTKGWRKYNGKTVPDQWLVIDGTLVVDPHAGKQGGDMVTADQYANFELALEWKISPGGNSGVMYRVAEGPGAPYQTGPEYQLLDNTKHGDGKNPLTQAGSAYAVYAPSKDVTRPVGQWNETRLIVNGHHVEHWLNGEKVVEYELGSEDWQKRVAASKFRAMPRYGKEAQGHIDLQNHGNAVAFRNVKVRVLADQGQK